MQKTVLFLLLFLFSFVIAHDSVITVIADKYTVTPQSETQQYDHTCTSIEKTNVEIAKLHTMFHFVALEPTCFGIFLSQKLDRTIEQYRFQPITAEQSGSYKPPIV